MDLGTFWVGVMAVLGIWLCNGVTLPMVTVLKEKYNFRPEHLMMARGVVTAFPALLIASVQQRYMSGIDEGTFLLMASFSLASLSLYKGIEAWGASKTITVVALTPVANFAMSWLSGKSVPLVAIISMVVMFAGVACVVWPGTKRDDTTPSNRRSGAFWSLMGIVLNAMYYEALAMPHAAPQMEVAFYQACAVGIVGFAGTRFGSKTDFALPYFTNGGWSMGTSLLGFGLVGGLLYFLCNIWAFEALAKIYASVLAQGETPVVVLLAGLIAKERLNAWQWFGVVLTFVGACYLTYWLRVG